MLLWTTWTPERERPESPATTSTGCLTWGSMPPWGTVTTSLPSVPPPRPATRVMLRLALCR